MVSKFIPSRSQKSTNEHSDIQPKVIQEFKDKISNGGHFFMDHSALAGVIDAVAHTNSIDDRKMLLEQVLVLLSRLPPGKLSTRLTHSTVELHLPHPPLTSVGDQYAWRAPDGSGNNLSYPALGRAGSSYARSVQGTNPLPRHLLPDPGLIFDTLLRREKFVQHPAGLSSLMFAFAALVVHSIFRTSHTDVTINETSSYVDLAPLYGVNSDAQAKVRVCSGRDLGRGLLKPDTFSEDRLLLLPPAVPALLVLFNRNHNYIANKLFQINERKIWEDPDKIPFDENREMRIRKQDEEIFQISRLCNCGWFTSVVFSDYLSTILGLVRQGSSWSLDTSSEFRDSNHSVFERSRGNACSVEFNCLYRWHSTTSKEDEDWVADLMAHTFPGKRSDSISPTDFKTKLAELEKIDTDVSHWTFGKLQRLDDGTFPDQGLADLLKNATEHKAGAFKARGTPDCMRWIEIMGIEANRRWGCCSLNEFRKYLGLKAYANFREWNPDPEIASVAEKLYGDIENLELYVGLQAEESKPVVQGAGLCPGYTISRAILADAVALVRGDRYYTSDYSPHNLTAWGYHDCQRSNDNAGFGSMLGRLILRTLPRHYTEDSTFTWFPLMTREAMKEILHNVETKDKYDFKRPEYVPAPLHVKEYGEVVGILTNKTKFQAPFMNRVAPIISGPGFFLVTDDREQGERERQAILRAVANTPEQVDAAGQYFYETTQKLIDLHSYTLVGGKVKSIDLVRDVLRAVPIHWVATQLAGIDLKETPDGHGAYSALELYDILDSVYSYFFDNVESSTVIKLGQKVEHDVKHLLHHIESNAGRLSLSGIVNFLTSTTKSGRQSISQRLHQNISSSKQLSNSILAIMVGASVELSEALTHMVDLLLEDTNIQKVLADGKRDEPVLNGYISEVLRIRPPAQGVYRRARASDAVGTLSINEEDLVFVDLTNANRNEQAFANANKLDPYRSQDNLLKADLLTKTLGEQLLSKIMIQVLRAVLELGSVRRAPGQSGELNRFIVTRDGIPVYRYLNSKENFTQWAQNLVIQYDVVRSDKPFAKL